MVKELLTSSHCSPRMLVELAGICVLCFTVIEILRKGAPVLVFS